MRNSASQHVEACLGTGIIRFIRELRTRGLWIPPDSGVSAIRALRELDLSNRLDVRTALESTLISTAEDLPVFRALFEEFWEHFSQFIDRDLQDSTTRGRLLRSETSDGEQSRPTEVPEPDSEALLEEQTHSVSKIRTEIEGTSEQSTQTSNQTTRSLYSPGGTTEPADIPTQVQPKIWDEIDLFLEAAGLLPGRRRKPDNLGEKLNLRKAVRESFQTGGEIFNFPRKRKRKTAFRGCFLVDVSQSVLDTINTSFLLEFLFQVERRARRSTIFFFDHTIRDVTGTFQKVNRNPSMEELKSPVTEWGGGTKIGESIRTLRRKHPTSVERRTGTFIISDGLDRGEREVLKKGIIWLRRKGGYIVWLNPLATNPDYEPLSWAMKVCLPHVDHLFGFAGREDLVTISDRLRKGSVSSTYTPSVRS